MKKERVELHVHTKMSAMDGVNSAADLIRRAVLWGHPAIAITDHGAVQAFPEAMQAATKCRAQGQSIKILYGMEAYYVDDTAPENAAKTQPYHLTILAQNRIGLKNLYEFVSRSHLQDFHRYPCVTKRELMEHREGLLLGSGCAQGELYRAILDGKPASALTNIAKLYDFLEIQPAGGQAVNAQDDLSACKEQVQAFNRTIVRLGETLQIPVCATGDVHFLDPEDEENKCPAYPAEAPCKNRAFRQGGSKYSKNIYFTRRLSNLKETANHAKLMKRCRRRTMLYLSKSKYCALWQCPKLAWLQKYKPEEMTVDSGALSRMETGNEVGDLAMGLFGDYVEVTAYNGDKLDLTKMIENTKAEMAKGTPILCEASFDYNGLYCAVDILKQEDGGWAVYEVKSSTHEDKAVYIADVAYQKYVLEHCGVSVTGTYLVTLNGDYVFDGTPDIHRLFKITDVAQRVKAEEKNIEPNLSVAERLLASKEEPDIDLADRCNQPHPCGFWQYCTRHLPKPCVFDLYRMPFAKKLEFYKKGKITFPDLLHDPGITNETQLRQMQYAVTDCGTYVAKEKIRDFLKTLSYPLYFLDFETMQPAIPRFIGTTPYMQLPFQYSLHYIEREGGEPKHTEFLAESGSDPRRELAERLCADIPADACVTAYNKKFECGRIRELAAAFPDLAEHLLNIERNIRDLLDPFQKGYYYNRAMGGSFSIKSVLPAVFPDDPTLDYHNLEGVHHGGEAMELFPKIKDLPPEEQKKARHDLLKYCELDTFAMVKVWQELVRVSKENEEEENG